MDPRWPQLVCFQLPVRFIKYFYYSSLVTLQLDPQSIHNGQEIMVVWVPHQCKVYFAPLHFLCEPLNSKIWPNKRPLVSRLAVGPNTVHCLACRQLMMMFTTKKPLLRASAFQVWVFHKSAQVKQAWYFGLPCVPHSRLNQGMNQRRFAARIA